MRSAAGSSCLRKSARVAAGDLCDLREILRATELTPALGFVDDDQSDRHLDVSGLTVDGPTGCLWIVSDRAGSCSCRSGGMARPESRWDGSTERNRATPHAEGIAHASQADQLYIVNDDGKASRLFTLEVLRGGEDQ